MNKKILITGHTQGIGKALTNSLLQMDFFVTGIARTKLKENKNLNQYVFDLSLENDIRKVCNVLEKEKFDVVILNAGYNDIKPPESYTVNEILNIYNINLISQAAILKSCLNGLIQNNGWIFGIGSYSALSVSKWNNFYGSAKAGLHHLMMNMFEQYRRQNIKVTLIIPDIVNSAFYKHQQFEPESDEKTYLKPEEIAGIITDLIVKNPEYVPLELVLRPQKFGLKRK